MNGAANAADLCVKYLGDGVVYIAALMRKVTSMTKVAALRTKVTSVTKIAL